MPLCSPPSGTPSPPPAPTRDPIVDNFTLFTLPGTQRGWTSTNFDAQLYQRTDTPTTLEVTYQVSAADLPTCKRFYPQRTCGPIHGFAAQLDPAVFGSNLNVSGVTATINPDTRSLQVGRAHPHLAGRDVWAPGHSSPH